MDLSRVCVVGSPGSGKTTFAGDLARRLDVPHLELDELFWLPNWTEPPREEFHARVREAIAQPRWVMCGNYGSARGIIWPRMTAVVWLNYSFPRVFGRLFSRTVRRAWTREELFGGNRESWRMSFLTKESILWWMLIHFRRYRREYADLSDVHPIVPLRHPRDAERFLSVLSVLGTHPDRRNSGR